MGFGLLQFLGGDLFFVSSESSAVMILAWPIRLIAASPTLQKGIRSIRVQLMTDIHMQGHTGVRMEGQGLIT